MPPRSEPSTPVTPESFYAWFSREHGLVAAEVDGVLRLLASPTMEAALQFRPFVEASARQLGVPVYLLRFEEAEELVVIDPNLCDPRSAR